LEQGERRARLDSDGREPNLTKVALSWSSGKDSAWTLYRLGDVISVAYGGKKSRFKVVWLRDSDSHHLIQAAMHLLKAETCLWINTSEQPGGLMDAQIRTAGSSAAAHSR
jgi:hypothetical protein